MGIIVLSDVIIPNRIIVAGVRGKQIRNNRRVSQQNGEMQINVGRSNTLRQYELGTAPLSVADWQALEGLFEVTEGGAYGCLLQDPKDCGADASTGKATLIDAGDSTYQLIKRYTSLGSTRTKDRIIRRPILASFVLNISGTPTMSYTLNNETGVVEIPADPAAADVSWSGLFYVPVHFASDEIDWELSAAGNAASRLMTGPSVVLDEVVE